MMFGLAIYGITASGLFGSTKAFAFTETKMIMMVSIVGSMNK
jgi:hypothetical protein